MLTRSGVTHKHSGSMSDIKKELKALRIQIENARTRFQLESEPELVESAIYEIKSLDARYNYLIKSIKKNK